ncbi:MAG: hypothetical protein IKO93_13095, partial [Lentisphaeria bacterium]|nr:hypothetical protein [Lentisphaeria bacterium]
EALLREDFCSIDKGLIWCSYEVIGDKDKLFDLISTIGEALDGYEGKAGDVWTEFFSQTAEENLTKIEAELQEKKNHARKQRITALIVFAFLAFILILLY